MPVLAEDVKGDHALGKTSVGVGSNIKWTFIYNISFTFLFCQLEPLNWHCRLRLHIAKSVCKLHRFGSGLCA